MARTAHAKRSARLPPAVMIARWLLLHHTQVACVRLVVAVAVVPTKAHILQPRFETILIRLYTTSGVDGTEPRGRVTQVLTLSRHTPRASMILRLQSTRAFPAEALRAARVGRMVSAARPAMELERCVGYSRPAGTAAPRADAKPSCQHGAQIGIATPRQKEKALSHQTPVCGGTASQLDFG